MSLHRLDIILTMSHKKEPKRYIVLGWDPSSAQAVKSLLCLGMEVVVVTETEPEALPPDVKFVAGPPAEKDSLQAAGIEYGDGLLLALPADKARRAIAMARTLNANIHVVASLQDDDSEIALWSSGAGLVIDAQKQAGKEMVRLMLEPGKAAAEDDDSLCCSRIPVPHGSPWAGLRLADLRGKLSHVSVAAVLPGGDSANACGNDDAKASEGDLLLVLGTKSQLRTALRTAKGGIQ